eukprot:TRINITY_DN4911_c0_g1_i5.p1 TRINITY_DN4911_c0_g1~~TRINITY_DN4911_c0_g1_i5.p1  ORF type:complete len:471 (-),score=76.78 TRINITY_DN4911_c0_g1_i5:413-1825(-)
MEEDEPQQPEPEPQEPPHICSNTAFRSAWCAHTAASSAHLLIEAEHREAQQAIATLESQLKRARSVEATLQIQKDQSTATIYALNAELEELKPRLGSPLRLGLDVFQLFDAPTLHQLCVCRSMTALSRQILVRRRAKRRSFVDGHWFYLEVRGHTYCRQDCAEFEWHVPQGPDAPGVKFADCPREPSWDGFMLLPLKDDADADVDTLTIRTALNMEDQPGFEFTEGSVVSVRAWMVPRQHAVLHAPSAYFDSIAFKQSPPNEFFTFDPRDPESPFLFVTPSNQAKPVMVAANQGSFQDSPEAKNSHFSSLSPSDDWGLDWRLAPIHPSFAQVRTAVHFEYEYPESVYLPVIQLRARMQQIVFKFPVKHLEACCLRNPRLGSKSTRVRNCPGCPPYDPVHCICGLLRSYPWKCLCKRRTLLEEEESGRQWYLPMGLSRCAVLCAASSPLAPTSHWCCVLSPCAGCVRWAGC